MRFLYRHRVMLGFLSITLALTLTFVVCFFALSRTAASAHQITVVIDAGHGGVDGGVVGVQTGQKESDINLQIARKLQRRMEDLGFRVVMTRTTEAGLYDVATKGFKMRDMKKRAEIIGQALPALVLSIHQNFFSDRSRRGGQVFFKPNSKRGETLACMIQSSLNAMPQNVRQYQPLKGDYYILNCSDFPSVIVECGFLSNAEDENLLTDEAYQKEIVNAIASGAMSFLTSSVNVNV